MLEDRRGLSWRDIIIAVSFVVNFGGLIWGAATVAANVASLTATLSSLQRSVSGINDSVVSLKIEYARLQAIQEMQQGEPKK